MVATAAGVGLILSLLAVVVVVAVVGYSSPPAAESPGKPPTAGDAFGVTVISVSGQLALLEYDDGERGQALNPYPSLLPGDRVVVQARAMAYDENRITGCDAEERASLPAAETAGALR